MSNTVWFWSYSSILKYLSIDWIGPGKLKSNPNNIRIWASRSINYYLLVYFYSSSVRRFIILVKLGDTGCSSFADINMLIVDKLTTFSFRKFWTPNVYIYLSNIPAATNNVSYLYSFFWWRSKIFYIPYDRSWFVIILSIGILGFEKLKEFWIF